MSFCNCPMDKIILKGHVHVGEQVYFSVYYNYA